MREVETALNEQLPGAEEEEEEVEEEGDGDSTGVGKRNDKKKKKNSGDSSSETAVGIEDQQKMNNVKGEGGNYSEKDGKTSELRIGQEWVLMNGLIPPPIDNVVGQALDSLCPALATSKELHDKALRLVFSVGMDAVILDAELSSMIGPLSLRPEDMLASNATDDVWGNFMVPADDEQ